MITQNKRLFGIIVAALALLSIPLIAMQFTNEVDWSASDFLIMGTLLVGTGLVCELVLRTVKKTTHRLILCGIILVCLFFTWVELAVGIFGTPFAGN